MQGLRFKLIGLKNRNNLGLVPDNEARYKMPTERFSCMCIYIYIYVYLSLLMYRKEGYTIRLENQMEQKRVNNG